MAVPISNVARRVVFTASGTGPYAFTFEILAQTDIEVYNNTTKLSLTTNYTVTINANGTGSITLVATPTAGTITIVGARTIERTSDFTTGGDLFATTLNDELDSLTIFIQQNAEDVSRSITAPVTDPTTIDMELPAKDDRKGKVLAFNATSGNPEAGPEIADVSTLSAITADIGVLADIEDGTDATDAIQTVAGISSNVTTVAGISGNVTSVAGVASLITSDFVSDINLVATTDFISDINALATSDFVSDLNAVEAIKANVTTVAGVSGNVTTVAGISSNVTTVAGVSSNVTTVAGISSDVTAVAGDATDIGTVSTNIANVNTVAGVSSNVTTVAGSISNVNTVASNISNVNSFANVYRIGSSDPTSSLDEGDLFYNSTDNVLRFYDGSAWVTVDAGNDIKSKVSSNDTTAGFLNGKLVASTNITLTENNDGGNETLGIAVNPGTTLVQKSSDTGSAYIPSGTTAQRDGSPAAGYLRFNSTTGQAEIYTGSAWSAVGGGPGTIVQVVNATANTSTTSTSTTYADTGLTASITPSSTSNKVLVLFSQAGCHKAGGNTHGRLKLLRDSTDLYEPDNYYGWTNSTSNAGVATISGCYLDSPSSSSSVTYKTQFNNGDGAGTVYVQILSGTSTITLMEVVA